MRFRRAGSAPRAVRRAPAAASRKSHGRGRRDRRRRAVRDRDDVVCVATSDAARCCICKVDEMPELGEPGPGVTVIKSRATTTRASACVAPREGRRDGPRSPRRRRRQGSPSARRSQSASPRRQGTQAVKRKTQNRVATPAEPWRATAPPVDCRTDDATWPAIQVHRPKTSPSSRAWSRSASAPACTSAAPTATGYHHLLWEIVDNSVDEVINGYGDAASR